MKITLIIAHKIKVFNVCLLVHPQSLILRKSLSLELYLAV
jgi:hypothetical protein